MLKIGFGNRVKPRTFDFVPRYYDPAKEELAEKLKKYSDAGTQEDNLENLKSRIRTNLRMKHYGDPDVRSSQVAKSNIRLLYIIIVLGLVAYILLSSNKIIGLLEAFTQ
jgi:hypothetical protein